jgi:hypothetical protein
VHSNGRQQRCSVAIFLLTASRCDICPCVRRCSLIYIPRPPYTVPLVTARPYAMSPPHSDLPPYSFLPLSAAHSPSQHAKREFLHYCARDCATAQAVSRQAPMAPRVRAQLKSCGICGGQSGTGTDILRVIRILLPLTDSIIVTIYHPRLVK